MTNYQVDVTRDGKWWMVSIPQLDGLTQARRVGEVEAHALAEAKALAHELAEHNVPVRDIGAILGVTFQRASQLVNS